MVEWKTVKLADVLRHRKGTIKIDDSQEYKLCRVQLHRRGIVLREKILGSRIKTKKQQVCREGDLVVAEMDAKFGGYGFIPPELDGAIVSSHYYLYELDKSKITQEYFETLIHSKRIQDQIEAKGSTNYSSIRAWEFLDYQIPLPILRAQRDISRRFHAFNDFRSNLDLTHHDQSGFLKQLRQTILQEAIEGKLTAKWREEHPVRKGDPEYDAAALLEQIKAEKQKLIAEGKIKKEKPLPLIKPDEMPFQIPQGWVWCHLSEVAEELSTGPFGSMLHKSDYVKSGIPVVNPMNVVDGNILADDRMQISEKTRDRLKRYALNAGDLVIARRGNLRKCAVVQEEQNGWLCGTGSFFLRILAINKAFLQLAYCSENSQKFLLRDSIGQTMDNLNQKLLFRLPLAVPALGEQRKIVDRVSQLLSMVSDLEAQVAERKAKSDELMQAVLREAFESNNHGFQGANA